MACEVSSKSLVAHNTIHIQPLGTASKNVIDNDPRSNQRCHGICIAGCPVIRSLYIKTKRRIIKGPGVNLWSEDILSAFLATKF